MRNRNMHHRKTHLAVPQWTKGICHLWSRGRHFTPFLPGDRYLKLCSKSDLRAEISGSRRKGFVTYGLGADISLPPCLATGIWNFAPKATSGPEISGSIFRFDALAPRPEVLRFISFMLIQCSGHSLRKRKWFVFFPLLSVGYPLDFRWVGESSVIVCR